MVFHYRPAWRRGPLLGVAAAAVAAKAAFGLQSGSAPVPASHIDTRFPPISVAVYDFDATALQPSPTASSAEERVNYGRLYLAASGFFENALGSDPRRSALKLFDFSFPQGASSIEPRASFHPLLPGSDDETATDFIISGKVSGMPGNYTLTVVVQDSKTREEVASTTVPFANAGDALVAGKTAETQLAPLADKIEAFERRKRDADENTAIRATLTVAAAKPVLQIGESTLVKVTLTDCDGAVLKNRKVTLTTDGPATISPPEVTTDTLGVAQAKVTGAGRAGPATVIASYSYVDVTHRQALARNGWALLQVGSPPGDVWEVRVDMSEQTEEVFRSSVGDSRETTITTSATRIGMVGWLSARPGASAGSVESQNLIAQSGGGDYLQIYTEIGRTIDTGNGDLVRTSKDHTAVLGHFAPGKMTSESMSFIINPPYKGNPKYNIKPTPGSFLVAINGFPEDAARRGHSLKEYFGKNPRPPAILDQDDQQQVRTGLFSASSQTTPEMMKSQTYTIVKKVQNAAKPGTTDEAHYTITLRPLKHG